MLRKRFALGLIAAGVLLLWMTVIHFLPGPKPAEVTAAVASAPAQPNPARVAQCREILKSAPRGAVRSYKLDGDYGTVIVGPVFYTAPFDAKQALDATLRCVLADGRADNHGVAYVEYKDMYSNKEVAKWSNDTGFSME